MNLGTFAAVAKELQEFCMDLNEVSRKGQQWCERAR